MKYVLAVLGIGYFGIALYLFKASDWDHKVLREYSDQILLFTMMYGAVYNGIKAHEYKTRLEKYEAPEEA